MKAIRREVLSEEEVRRIITNLVDVVAYLHDYGVVHRDIKVRTTMYVHHHESV